jgi:lipopolysaccharide biosynthesis regulator YciM
MRNLLLIAVLLALTVLQQGCGSDYRPNTKRGHHLDEKNKHIKAIAKYDQVIFRQNKEYLPEEMNQLEQAVGIQARFKARMKAMREGN